MQEEEKDRITLRPSKEHINRRKKKCIESRKKGDKMERKKNAILLLDIQIYEKMQKTSKTN